MRLIILIASFFLSFSAFANLPKSQQFLVSGIEVSEIDESAELARQKALDTAQKTAFHLLLNRIYNIDVEEETDLSDIHSLVSSIELNNETITNKTYSAVVDVQFNEEFTRFFINNNYLDKTATAPNILLIPVYDENGFLKLWQRGNAWLSIWNSIPKDQLLNIHVPIGDFNDITKFRTSNLQSIDKEAAQLLAAEYGVDKIIVSRLYQRYGPLSKTVDFSAILYELGDFENNTVIAEMKAPPGVERETVMKKFSQKIINSFNAAWVNFSNKEIDEKRVQEFLVMLSDVSDWQKMQTLLKRPTFVKSYKLLSISSKYAHISVKFTKEILKGIEDLKDYDFEVIQGKEGLLILKGR